MAEMHTHTGTTLQFFYETFAFLPCSPRSKSFLVNIIFLMPTQSSWSYIPPMHCPWTHLQSSMPPTQLKRHFHKGNNCILFTLGNRCTSCCFMLPVSYFSSLPSMEFIRHFHGVISILFTLGNRSISCYATHAICAACQNGSSNQYSTLPGVYSEYDMKLYLTISIQFWNSGGGGNHLFVAITPRSTLSWSSITCLEPTYESYTSVLDNILNDCKLN